MKFQISNFLRAATANFSDFKFQISKRKVEVED
jgi:hypothetical protein